MEPADQILALAQKFQAVTLRLPVVVGNVAVNFTLDNFQRQGFLNTVHTPWQQRKPGWKKDKRTGRGILINTGRLRRSVRIVRVAPGLVVIGSDVPYARAHNEGVKLGVIQTVKGFSRKSGQKVTGHQRRINMRLPKRQFMGNSQYQTQLIKRAITLEYIKAIPQIRM